jgi:hypothetical protein
VRPTSSAILPAQSPARPGFLQEQRAARHGWQLVSPDFVLAPDGLGDHDDPRHHHLEALRRALGRIEELIDE